MWRIVIKRGTRTAPPPRPVIPATRPPIRPTVILMTLDLASVVGDQSSLGTSLSFTRRVLMAMAKTNILNISFIVFGGRSRVTFPPRTTPITMAIPMGMRKEKLGLMPAFMKLIVFMIELKKMRVSEVAITACGGRNEKNV